MSNLDRLLGLLQKVRRSGAGWTACCPAHDDKTPSLGINLGDDGRTILLVCHAKRCSVEAIVSAIGLEVRDLFEDGPRASAPKTERPRIFTSFDEAAKCIDRSIGAPWKRVRSFVYSLADGTPVLYVIRYEDGKGEKTIRPVSRSGSGWIIGNLPDERPLYGLPELKGAPVVLVVEGEKCVEAAWDVGLVATTSAGGAKAAAKTDWTPLAGKDVVLLPDCDEAGRQYVREVESILLALDPPARVRVLDLPGLAEHEDLADFIERARAAGESPDSIRERLRHLIAASPTSMPEARVARDRATAFQPFPVGVFPPGLRAFFEFFGRADCVDPSFLALPTLSNLAGAVGNAAEVELKHGWTQPAVLWTCAVGKSGTRKSVALRRVVDPLNRLQRKARKDYEKKFDEYLRLSNAFEAQEKASKKDASIVLGDRPVKPVQRRYVVTDTTAEALASILAKQEQGIIVARDELAGLVRGFNQYKARGGSDEAFWLSLFDGTSVYIERKTGEERSIAVDRPAVSIAGGVQPGVLADVFPRAQQENGLLARILFAYPPDVEAKWNEESPPPGMEERFALVFDRLSNLPLEHWPEGGVKPRRLTLGSEAHDMFAAFYEEHARETMSLDDGGSASYSKLLGICGRLALVLELARWADSEDPGLLPERVSNWAMEGAIKLARWFAREALRVQVLLTEAGEQRDLGRIERRIAALGGDVSVRDWQRKHHRMSSEQAQDELDSLALAGRAHWLPGTGRSRVLRLGPPTGGARADGPEPRAA